jgi:hypothetical protein
MNDENRKNDTTFAARAEQCNRQGADELVKSIRSHGHYLNDGERRVMQPGILSKYERQRIKVVAECVDCDTPLVELRIPYECVTMEGEEIVLVITDTLAEDIAKRLTRALSILPTSK